MIIANEYANLLLKKSFIIIIDVENSYCCLIFLCRNNDAFNSGFFMNTKLKNSIY